MTDSYTPTYSMQARSSGNSLDERSISTRIRLLTQINPYMADRPDALQAMAMSSMDNQALIATGGQHYAMQVSDQLAGQLSKMSPGAQRAVISQLTPAQQSSLQAMGYQTPQRQQDPGVLGDIVGAGADLLSFVGSGVAAIPGVKAVGGAALEGLTWVGNWPGHIYRTIRSQDDTGQAAGILGAVAGIAAVALAVPTGGASLAALGAGGSLMALGALGLGGLAGGAVGSALVNPNDWGRAFGETWEGEQSFDRPSRQRADSLLHDTRMRGVAEDLANADLDIIDLAHELAGQADTSRGSQMHKIEQLAATMAQPGTEQYTNAVNAMLNAVQDPTFQTAIQALTNGKMSPGRDLADLFGLNVDSGVYSALSGGVDAVFTMAVDPTLMLGKANEFYKASRYTVKMFEGADLATEFMKVAKKPAVLAYHTLVAEAVAKNERGGMQLMRSLNATFDRGYVDLVEHAQSLVATGAIDSVAKFDVKHLQKYYSEWANLKPALEGIGTKANARGIQLMEMGVTRRQFHDFRLAARSFTSGLSDVRIERDLIEKAELHGEAILNALPDQYRGMLTTEGLIAKPWQLNQANQTWYEIGRAASHVPFVGKFGDVATALSTMALSGKAVAVTGSKAAQDVRALSEMGRYMGMPSWGRQAWADAMMSADSTAARVQLMNGWLGNMLKLTGAEQTDEGARIINEYLQRSKQLYSSVDDTLLINGRRVHLGLFTNQQADMVVMPNIKELLQASKTSVIATRVMGIADLPVFEAAINKVWKPIILLRLGFIPRAAGEELAGFLARGGIGSLTQEFGGRFIGKLKAYEEAVRKSSMAATNGISLSIGEKALVEGGLARALPAHVRPVVRMLGRSKYQEPAVEKLGLYASWLSDHLQSGMGLLDGAERRIANLAGATGEVGKGLELAGLEGVKSFADATALLRSRLTSQHMRINAANYVDSIMLGGDYSIRRMLMGGVHDDLVDAGRTWAALHATTMMRETSAINAGPVAQSYDGKDLVSVLRENRDGDLRPVVVHQVRGQRRLIGQGNSVQEVGAFQVGVHDAAHVAVNNELTRRFAGSTLSRVRGDLPVSEESLGAAADALLGLGRAKDSSRLISQGGLSHHARALTAELLDGSSLQTWQATRATMSRSNEGRRYVEVLEAYLPEKSSYTVDELIDAFTRGAKDVQIDEFVTPAVRAEFKRTQKRLHGLSEQEGVLDDELESAVAEFNRLDAKAKSATVATGEIGPDHADAILAQQRMSVLQDQITRTRTELASVRTESLKIRDVVNKSEGRSLNHRLELTNMAKTLRDEVKPVTTWLDSLDPTSRAFAAQYLHEASVGGKNSHRAAWHAEVRHYDKRMNNAVGRVDESHLNLEQLAFERGQAESLAGALRDDAADEAVTAAQTKLRAAMDAEAKAKTAHQTLLGERDAAVAQRAQANTWLYGSLDEAMPDITRQFRSGLMDPNNHDEHISASLRSLQLDDKGQFVDTQHRNATVMLYEVPAMRTRNFDELLARSANPKVLQENRPLVERMLNTSNAQDTQLVADFELATELSRLRADAAGIDVTLAPRPRHMRRPRRVTDGRQHGALTPDVESKVNKQTQLWTYPTAGAEVNLKATADSAIDPITEWAQAQANHLVETIGRGRRQTVRAKQRVGEPLADGSATSDALVYRWKDGELMPVGPDEELSASMAGEVRDYRGGRIDFGDPEFFEAPVDVAAGAGGDVMWELMSPMLRDTYDDLNGASRFARRDASVSLGRHAAPQQSVDLVPVTRSKATDVGKVPLDSQPQFTFSQVMQDRPVGKWEQVVKFGFDRIIGPSIDAIVRKPMAFHAYAQRFTAGKKAMHWAIDPALLSKTESIMRDWGALAAGVDLDANHLTDVVRAVASFHTDDVRAAKWTTNQSLAWLRSHSEGELQDILVRVATRSKGIDTPAAKLANVYGRQLAKYDHGAIVKATSMGTTPEAFMAMVESKLPAGALRSVRSISNPANQEAVRGDELLSWLQANDKWDDIVAMKSNLDHIEKTVGEAAATAAIADVVPFLDSHEFKTQFADYGKGFMPFWYAEENFMKRWARGLAEQGPQMIRKMQLTYMGMRHAGIVRTDSSGKDWFVYPGSGLLTEAVSKMVPGLSSIYDVGVMFQSPTDQMLPGMSSKIAAPSFNPLVTIPMDLVSTWMPELQPIERSLLGDFASQRAVIDQVYPAHFRNLIEAVTGDDSSGTRYASAQMSAIAYMEAHDQGLPDNATAGQVDEYMRRIREHARIIVIAQALAGFATPGSPSTLEAGDTGSFTGLGVADPADVLSNEYLTLVRMLGVEDGTAKFLEMNKDATLDDISNPLALTTPRNVSRSGAPLPATESSLEFSIRNEDYLHEFPNAAPWLLPQNFEQGTRSEYAYTQQTINGLRRRRTPEEYLRAMKFKEGASEYFIMRDHLLDEISKAELAQNKPEADRLRTDMERALLIYRTAHPVFREELESSDGRVRRRAILEEMQSVIKDPQAPDTDQTRAIKTAMQAFNAYRVQLGTLADNRTNVGLREIENLKLQYSTYMATLVKANPGIMSFWKSVLQPESSLD